MQKKYLIKTINFGRTTDPARQLITAFIRKHGKQSLSILIRRLVIAYLSADPSYQKFYIKVLKNEYKELGKIICEASKRKVEITTEVTKLGGNPDDLIF